MSAARREPARNDVDAALAAMGADALREVVREMLGELDERAHSRVVSSLIRRAARSGSGWTPAALSDDEVADVVAFARAAERLHHADPSDVDEHLRRGSGAFLRRDYGAAHRIFGALLRSIGEGEIDLGQHDTLRGPDVTVVAREREPSGRGEAGWLEGAPDLAVEIGGDSQSVAELTKKALEYLAAGRNMVWVLDPDSQRVLSFTPPDHVRVLGSQDELDGGTVLPDFRCRVAELFEP